MSKILDTKSVSGYLYIMSSKAVMSEPASGLSFQEKSLWITLVSRCARGPRAGGRPPPPPRPPRGGAPPRGEN